MSINHNKYIASRYFKEIMTAGDLGTLYELLAAEFVFTLPTHPEPYVGPEGFQDLVTMLHGCFPDFFIKPQKMVAAGDTVLIHWRGGGTHLGGAIHTVAGDVPASGRYFEIDGMSWMRIKNNQIVEVIGHEDTISMFEQLGILPSPRTTTTPEENLAMAHRYLEELLSQGKFSIMDEILSEDFQFNLPTQPTLSGKEALRGYISYLRSAIGDLKFEVDRKISADNEVAIRWKISGTHQGEFNGAAPTGNHVEEFGVNIFEFWQGKIRSVQVVANQLGLSNQMMARKAEPDPAAAEKDRVSALMPAAFAPGEGRKKMDILGFDVTIKVSSHDVNGAYFVYVQETPVGGSIPPHIHEHEDETVYVIDGKYELLIGDHTVVATAGDTAHFPRHMPHGISNIGKSPGRTLWSVVPGTNFETFFERLSLVHLDDPQAMEKMGKLFAEHGMEILPPAAE